MSDVSTNTIQNTIVETGTQTGVIALAPCEFIHSSHFKKQLLTGQNVSAPARPPPFIVKTVPRDMYGVKEIHTMYIGGAENQRLECERIILETCNRLFVEGRFASIEASVIIKEAMAASDNDLVIIKNADLLSKSIIYTIYVRARIVRLAGNRKILLVNSVLLPLIVTKALTMIVASPDSTVMIYSFFSNMGFWH